MTKALAKRLAKLERAMPKHSSCCTDDVFADIDRGMDQISFLRREGRWPDNMSPEEIESMEETAKILEVSERRSRFYDRFEHWPTADEEAQLETADEEVQLEQDPTEKEVIE